MHISFIFITILLSITLVVLSKKLNFLLDIKSEKHKKFTSIQKNYSIGGILLIIFFMLSFFDKKEYLDGVFFFSIFLIGLFSDLKILNNPKIRFLLQIFSIILFVYLLDIRILDTRAEIFNKLLENNIFNYFFVTFCLMILINGSNFVDGINTLLINYFIIILGSLWLFLPESIHQLKLLGVKFL